VKLILSNNYPEETAPVLLLAHGAGAPADSPFMDSLAEALANQGVASVRFEFPYMEKRRQDGRRRPPDRQPRLLERFQEVLTRVRAQLPESRPVLVGGKSMGGRMASVLAAGEKGVPGVICFGYSFHPPGRTEQWRTGHFPDIHCPLLVLQGTRDPFGSRGELEEYEGDLGCCELVWLDGGNHDFRPPARQESSQQSLIEEAAWQTRRFLERHGLMAG